MQYEGDMQTFSANTSRAVACLTEDRVRGNVYVGIEGLHGTMTPRTLWRASRTTQPAS